MQKRSFADWLFLACFLIVGGAIAKLATGTFGCILMAAIVVCIIAIDNSDHENVSDLSVASDPSVVE